MNKWVINKAGAIQILTHTLTKHRHTQGYTHTKLKTQQKYKMAAYKERETKKKETSNRSLRRPHNCDEKAVDLKKLI